MSKRHTLVSHFSLDLDHGNFTRPFANESSSRSVQSRRSSSSFFSSFAKNLAVARKPPVASKLKESAEEAAPGSQVLESVPTPTNNADKHPSAPLTSPKMNPLKLQSLVTRLASKFQRSPRNATKPDPTPPSAVKISQERQRREAALRANGLLPPKDLSQIEQEQDLLIDSIDGPKVNFEETKDGQSAANEIKRAWELKNAVSLTPIGSSASLLLSPRLVSLVDPCEIPLPPSPAPSVSDLPATVVNTTNPYLIQLPSSPHAVPVRPKNPDASFRDWKFPKEATPLSLISPYSPPILSQEDSLLAPPSPLAETDSVMDASIATPSLIADSITQTTSFESVSATASPKLKVQTSINPGVQVIVESPVEETLLSAIPEIDDVTGHNDKPLDLPPPERTASDPDSARPKRKKPAKLTLRALQRTVVGTLATSKPKSPRADGVSPTSPGLRLPLPTRSATASSGGQLSPPLPRTPRSLTMYSPSAIVLEASNIEDEESRRLSEMAFLT